MGAPGDFARDVLPTRRPRSLASLLKTPHRGRRAGGFSPKHLTRTLAAHPDWETVGQVRYPDNKLGPAIRLLRQPVRDEIGLETSFAEAKKWLTEMAHGEAAWLSHFPEPKSHHTSNPGTKTQRTAVKSRETLVSPAGPDVIADFEELPGWLPLHSLEWEK